MAARSPFLFWVAPAEHKHGGYSPHVVHVDCPFSGSSRRAAFSHDGLRQDQLSFSLESNPSARKGIADIPHLTCLGHSH